MPSCFLEHLMSLLVRARSEKQMTPTQDVTTNGVPLCRTAIRAPESYWENECPNPIKCQQCKKEITKNPCEYCSNKTKMFVASGGSGGGKRN